MFNKPNDKHHGKIAEIIGFNRQGKYRLKVPGRKTAICVAASDIAQVLPPVPQLPILPPGANAEKVLMVGDGDRSFSTAYAMRHPDLHIFSSTLDTEEECEEKYGDFNAGLLSAAGHTVMYEVDARFVHELPHTFTFIYFNFPHKGDLSASGLSDLIEEFLASAIQVLKPYVLFFMIFLIFFSGGSIYVSVMNTTWYSQRLRVRDWIRAVPNLTRVNRRIGYLDAYRTLGYIHKKTNNNSQAGGSDEEVTYKFAHALLPPQAP